MAFHFNPFAWIKNAFVTQTLMAIGVTITAIVVAVAVWYAYSTGLYKTLPIIGDPNLKTFAELWDEAAEISDEVRPKFSYMSDVPSSPTFDCAAALISAQKSAADFKQVASELDLFDDKLPGLATAAGKIAAADARVAANDLVASADEWSDLLHIVVSAGQEVIDHEVLKIEALQAVGCITTDPEQLARAVEAIIPHAEAQSAIINRDLMPLLNSNRLIEGGEAHPTALQDFVDATGIILKPIASPTAAELGL